MKRASMPALCAGVSFVALAFPVSASLAAGTPWMATIGFWTLVAGPGILLIAHAIGRPSRSVLLPAVLAGVALIGLEVTDSVRPGVVVAGYAFFAGFLAAALFVALRLPVGRLRRRQHDVGPQLR